MTSYEHELQCALADPEMANEDSLREAYAEENMVRNPNTGDPLVDHFQRCECDECRAARNAIQWERNHPNGEADE